ncbi:MAG: hypothetical protein IJN29_10175 [Akkermansia sp.]|nr:hypothetical protein [Akkermansia sp.]
MSTPASAMTSSMRGLSPCFSTPAEYMCTPCGACRRANASAIWLRQELPVQRKRREDMVV